MGVERERMVIAEYSVYVGWVKVNTSERFILSTMLCDINSYDG